MSSENTLGLEKKLGMKYKQVLLLLRIGFKLQLEIIYLVRKERKNIFWLNGDGLKQLLTMNPIEKQMTKINMRYLVDSKNNICQHNKLHLLTDRTGKRISEKMYRDIEKSFSMIHRNTSLQRVETIYQIRNLLTVILNMISFVAQIVLNHCV